MSFSKVPLQVIKPHSLDGLSGVRALDVYPDIPHGVVMVDVNQVRNLRKAPGVAVAARRDPVRQHHAPSLLREAVLHDLLKGVDRVVHLPDQPLPARPEPDDLEDGPGLTLQQPEEPHRLGRFSAAR